jgi:hypothetical protein
MTIVDLLRAVLSATAVAVLHKVALGVVARRGCRALLNG